MKWCKHVKEKLNDEVKYNEFISIFTKYGDEYVEVLEIALMQHLQNNEKS